MTRSYVRIYANIVVNGHNSCIFFFLYFPFHFLLNFVLLLLSCYSKVQLMETQADHIDQGIKSTVNKKDRTDMLLYVSFSHTIC